MKFGLQRMLAIGFAAAVLAVGIVALATFGHYEEEKQNIAWAAHTDEVIAQLDSILLLGTASQSAVRGFIITGREALLEPFLDAEKKLPASIRQLQAMTADNPRQQHHIPELKEQADAMLAWHRELVGVARERDLATARDRLNAARTRSLFQSVRDVVDIMRAEEQRLRQSRWLAADTGATIAQATVTATLGVILVLLTGSYLLLRHVFMTRHRRETELRQFAGTLEERVHERTRKLEEAAAELRRVTDEQLRAEAARHEAEARFRSLVEQATDALLLYNATGQVLDVNQQACATLGYSRDELLGMNMHQIQGTQPNFPAFEWTSVHPGRPATVMTTYRRKDGSTFPAERKVGCHDFKEQRLYIELTRDITDRLRAEQNQAQLAAIVESSSDAIVSVDRDWNFISWNRGAEHLLGYTAHEMIGRSIWSIIPQDRMAEMAIVADRMREGESTGPYETLRRHKDGRLIPVAATASPLRNPEGRVIGGSGILRDFSERRQLEAEVLRVSEHEQQRLGHDLHDGIGQQLTAIELMLFRLAETHPAGKPRDWRREIELIGEHLRRVVGEVRGLARGLAPFVLDSAGLQSALSSLAAGASTSAVHCQFRCREPLPAIDQTAAMHFYRITQEALNNALKHSGASEISIRLEWRDNRIELEVADNGRGCPPRSGQEHGIGLKTMRYRADLIGADFTFRTAPGKGVAITCTLPLNP